MIGNDEKLTKDEVKRVKDAVGSLQRSLDDFNPDAEVTVKMQDNLNTIRAILNLETEETEKATKE